MLTNSIKKTAIINFIVLIVLLCIIDTVFRVVENFKEPAKAYREHKEFRLSRPEPYSHSNYFSKDFIQESFQQPQGWLTPIGTRIVIPNNYTGKWFNVQSNKRITVNQPRAFEKRILLFGGSTIYNSEVPDNFTVSSLLQKKLAANGFSRILVENYGVTSVHAAQQLERLQRDVQLSENDIVIFYDGVNDVIFRVYYDNPEGWVSQQEQVKHAPFVARLVRKLKKYSAFMRWVDDNILVKSFSNSDKMQEAAIKYATTISKANSHVLASQAKFIHFFQPTLFTKKNLNGYEVNLLTNLVGTDMVPVGLREAFEGTYPLMKNRLALFKFSFDLTNLYDNLDSSPYLDFCHVTENANEILANEIFEKMNRLGYLSNSNK
jgi:hypothetical protein